MSEKILKFNNIILNKKKFHKSKEPIDLLSVDLDQIVVSHKFKHNDKGFKYFIGYLKVETIKPLCIILPQMSGYINILKMVVKTCLAKKSVLLPPFIHTASIYIYIYIYIYMYLYTYYNTYILYILYYILYTTYFYNTYILYILYYILYTIYYIYMYIFYVFSLS